MASTPRIDELKKKFDENPRRYFAPLANEFRKAGDIEQAIVICEEFLPQQPGHMSGHIVYGQALFEAARLPESRTVFETALSLDPENLIALRHLGDIAHSQGDDADARAWYLRVLDADPRNEEIQALIAQLHTDEPLHSESSHEFAPPPSPVAVGEPEPVAETAPVSRAQTPPAAHMTFAPPMDPEPLDLDFAEELPQSVAPHMPHVSGAHDFVTDDFLPLASELEPLEGHDTMRADTTAFVPPEAPVAALDGLEINEGATASDVEEAHAAMSIERLPEFEALDDVVEEPSEEFAPLEFESGVPLELPPEVIAAEAAVTDDQFWVDAAPEEPEAAVEDFDVEAFEAEQHPSDAAAFEEIEPEPEPENVPQAAPFVTETMAELYLAQGFRGEALSVYEQLLAQNPSDTRLEGIVSSLSQPIEEPQQAGHTVRDFLSRIAARRPGNRTTAHEPPSDDDFAAAPAEPHYEDVPQPEPEMEMEMAPPETEELEAASPAQRAAFEAAVTPITNPRAPTPRGSIDAVFGNKPPRRSEDSAAAALSQAFGGATEEAPPLTGRPAHAAAGELTLDSVFRDAPARAQRTSQNFSFDQFFAGGSTSAERPSGQQRAQRSGETPEEGNQAERSGDDIEQFNSWLQGLKPQ